ncbi:hypothetical protein Patl1_04487 [Pistacia atlantica]|uniref:Uncharacterized protein n=1 Tax=Pistacia atlantica TaxID=434234 RepID=A0ACC1BWW9_9ROSI|nr:hypothetical protein Patl1_04487 [Pistacia atlantica]
MLDEDSEDSGRFLSVKKNQAALVEAAWKLWIEGRPLELIDKAESFTPLKALSECSLPQPKQPGFFIERDTLVADNPLIKNEPCSVNEITITSLEAGLKINALFYFQANNPSEDMVDVTVYVFLGSSDYSRSCFKVVLSITAQLF